METKRKVTPVMLTDVQRERLERLERLWFYYSNNGAAPR